MVDACNKTTTTKFPVIARYLSANLAFWYLDALADLAWLDQFEI
jgi:hypothetical protein